MLVLTRGVNEAIVIGDRIEVTVLEIKGGKVRLGIQAPGAIPVHRKEVWLALKQANVEAAQAAPQSPEELEKLMGGRKHEERKPGAGPAGGGDPGGGGGGGGPGGRA